MKGRERVIKELLLLLSHYLSFHGTINWITRTDYVQILLCLDNSSQFLFVCHSRRNFNCHLISGSLSSRKMTLCLSRGSDMRDE